MFADKTLDRWWVQQHEYGAVDPLLDKRQNRSPLSFLPSQSMRPVVRPYRCRERVRRVLAHQEPDRVPYRALATPAVRACIDRLGLDPEAGPYGSGR